MKEFEFSIPQKVIYGAGSLSKLPEVVNKLDGKKAFIISGPHLYKMGMVSKCAEALKEAGILCDVFSDTEAIGSSLGSTFVGQLIMREKVHIDHGIFGSPDLDQSGEFSAWLQSKLVVPLLTGFTKNEKKRNKMKEKMKNFFLMSDEAAEKFMTCFSTFSPMSIKNEYYTDLLTHLKDDIYVEHTIPHFIYANKMGEKYLKRYKKYFRNPDIREFDMQHEQWLFSGEEYAEPVLKAIDEFMEMPV